MKWALLHGDRRWARLCQGALVFRLLVRQECRTSKRERGGAWRKRVEGRREDETWVEVVGVADLSSLQGSRAQRWCSGHPNRRPLSPGHLTFHEPFVQELCVHWCASGAHGELVILHRQTRNTTRDCHLTLGQQDRGRMQCWGTRLGAQTTVLFASRTIRASEKSSEANCRWKGRDLPGAEAAGTAQGQPHSSVAGDFISG